MALKTGTKLYVAINRVNEVELNQVILSGSGTQSSSAASGHDYIFTFESPGTSSNLSVIRIKKTTFASKITSMSRGFSSLKGKCKKCSYHTLHLTITLDFLALRYRFKWES